MNDKKNEGHFAIRASSGARVFVTRGTFLGDGTGLIATSGAQFHLVDSKHISSDVLFTFAKLDAELEKQKEVIEKDSYEKILREVQNLKMKQGTKSYADAYTSFISTISDHVTVLTALAPLLGSLAHI